MFFGDIPPSSSPHVPRALEGRCSPVVPTPADPTAQVRGDHPSLLLHCHIDNTPRNWIRESHSILVWLGVMPVPACLHFTVHVPFFQHHCLLSTRLSLGALSLSCADAAACTYLRAAPSMPSALLVLTVACRPRSEHEELTVTRRIPPRDPWWRRLRSHPDGRIQCFSKCPFTRSI